MTDTPAPQQADIRPTVASPVSGRGPWVFGAGLTVGAVLLFVALDNHRRDLVTPVPTAPIDGGQHVIPAAPELVIPAVENAPQYPLPVQQAPVSGTIASATTTRDTRTPAVVASNAFETPSQAVPRASSTPSPAIAQNQRFDAPFGTPQPPSDSANGNGNGNGNALPRQQATKPGGKEDDRVEASHFKNPATTVPKGTIMQAVLETALNSDQPGFARAIISRDIYGFDGSKILVARGSRLIGEYKADVALGQNRVLIQWQRLMRPDGVVVELDSPSADPLGRAGVKGAVNSHFFQRFAGAILQSTLNIGAQVATRAATNDTFILALPGAIPGALGTGIAPEKIAPTIKVRQGSSVSVFVARDLDFSTVE